MRIKESQFAISNSQLHLIDPVGYIEFLAEILKGNRKKGKIPDLWDGKAAERIVSIVADKLIN